MIKSMKNFTLAELLIVIGVIGLVAALTIPALINTISPKAKEAQTKTIEARLLDGLNRYNAMEDGLSKPYETTKEFLEGLSKYYKMNAICDSDEITNCVPYAKISYEVGEGEDKIVKSIDVSELTENSKMMSTKAAQDYLPPASFITSQGTPVVIAFKRGCIWDNGTAMKDIRDSGCIALMYDKNGVNLPNKMGDDIVSLGLSAANSGLKIINGIKVMEKAFFPPKGLTKPECLAEIPKKDEYKKLGFVTGILGCGYDEDYWAYAMKYCKDRGWHLPNEEESLKLVQGLFKDSDGNIPTGIDFSAYTYDTKLASEISIHTYLWLGKQSTDKLAYKRTFTNLGTSVVGNRNRYMTNDKGICVGE